MTIWRFGLAILRAALAVCLVTALSAVALPERADAAGATTPRHAKVAIIVGPVGGFTAEYLAMGEAAAAAARRWTDNVVTAFTPDATWPQVRAALTGASVVVYLGHGNGWPSRYSSALRPGTMDGLGLNPVAGGDNTAHQYFGERYLARSVRLAPGAVVLLHHLCYASGAAEPGMAQPSLDTAVQRVDNYGAGWLAAGAAAVVAEAHGAPAYYINALFGRGGSIDSIWRHNPAFHDHVLAFGSSRTPGADLFLDPDQPATGFYRSLVTLPGASASTATAARPISGPSGPHGPGVVLAPSLAGSSAVGVGFLGPVIAASTATLAVQLGADTRSSRPTDMMIGTRWDALGLNVDGAAPAPTAPGGDGTGDAASTAPLDAADAGLVVPESPGAVVVTPAPSANGDRRVIPVITPDAPGLYRLVTTLHDSGGIAYDAPSQDRVPALIVRVTASSWATYEVAAPPAPLAGTGFTLRVGVANPGTVAWTAPVAAGDPGAQPTARLVAHWVPLDAANQDVGLAAGSTPADAAIPVDVAPGSVTTMSVSLTAPGAPGSWLLVLDVVVPGTGSLAAAGVPPALVPVTVLRAGPAPAAGTAAPTPTGSAAGVNPAG